MSASRKMYSRTAACLVVGCLCPAFGCHESDIVEGTTTWGGSDTGMHEPSDPFPDPFTFHISEATDFSVPNAHVACQSSDLNNVAWALSEQMEDENWTGEYLLNGQTDTSKFREGTFAGGADDQFADAHRVSIYAGHGSVGSIQWGTAGPNGVDDCWLNIRNFMRLAT